MFLRGHHVVVTDYSNTSNFLCVLCNVHACYNVSVPTTLIGIVYACTASIKSTFPLFSSLWLQSFVAVWFWDSDCVFAVTTS